MEKSQSLEREPPEAANMDDIKGALPAAQDVDLGQILEVHSTPEEERKVLWKLDWVYVWTLLISETQKVVGMRDADRPG